MLYCIPIFIYKPLTRRALLSFTVIITIISVTITDFVIFMMRKAFTL